MKISVINSGHFKLDGGAMHGVVPKSLWSRYNQADEHNLCNWAMRCILVEIDDRKILVDTGIGDKQNEKFFSHYYLHGDDTLIGNLAKAGFKPEDITDVFLTHLHFDHVGGAVRREEDQLVLTFPNATYWSHKDHWEWAVNPNPRERASFLKENIMPIQESGQLKFIDVKEGEEWLPGFKIRYVYGHTEAMMLPQLDYNGQVILYCADLIPSMAHIPLAWVMGYDMRPLNTLDEKARLLEEAVTNGYYLFFEHDPNIELCSLQSTEKGVRSKAHFTLSSI